MNVCVIVTVVGWWGDSESANANDELVAVSAARVTECAAEDYTSH